MKYFTAELPSSSSALLQDISSQLGPQKLKIMKAFHWITVCVIASCATLCGAQLDNFPAAYDNVSSASALNIYLGKAKMLLSQLANRRGELSDCELK